MADGGMRIDRGNPILQNPDLFSRSPLKKRAREDEQVSSLREKQVRDNQETQATSSARANESAPPESRKRKREDAGDLLPQVKRARTELPEKAEEAPQFNRNVWSSARPTQESGQKPLIGAHRLVLPEPQPVEKDPLLHMPKIGGYYVAQIIGQAYELHLLVQDKQLEVFKVTHAGVQKLRDEQIELIQERIKNEQLQTSWTYWGNVLEYFGITSNAMLGAGLMMTGNLPAGVPLVAGSALSLTGKLAREFSSYTNTGRGLSLAGGLVSGYGATQNLATLGANNLPLKLASATDTFKRGSELAVHYKQNQAYASQFSNRAKQVKNEYKRKVEEKEMEQIVSGLGKKDAANTIAAATKIISTEQQIMGDIARGKA